MYLVTKRIDFCYGHRLLNYDGKCRYLHGHNGRAVIVLESATLDGRGMVLDFSEIKQVVSRWIDNNLDHRMILCRDDPAVGVLHTLGAPLPLIAAPHLPRGRRYAIILLGAPSLNLHATPPEGSERESRNPALRESWLSPVR